MARAHKPRSPGCIVLAPTRELAKQVEREFAATGPTLKTACVYGGALLACHLNAVSGNYLRSGPSRAVVSYHAAYLMYG